MFEAKFKGTLRKEHGKLIAEVDLSDVEVRFPWDPKELPADALENTVILRMYPGSDKFSVFVCKETPVSIDPN